MITQRIFLFLLLAGTVSACSKDDTQTAEVPQNELMLTLDAGTSEFEPDEAVAATSELDTRAGYDGTKSIWHANDEIGISFDAVNTNLHFTQVAGTLSADSRRVSYNGRLNNPLSGNISAVAYYPYSATATVSGKTVTTTFPATQTYNAAGGYRGIPVFSSFTGDYNNIKLAFKNLYSVVKLNLVKGVALTNTIKLQKVIFAGNNNETVSGPMTVNMTNATPVVNLTGSGKNITLDMTASNVELTSAGQSFYIAVPAINYTKGFSFTIVTDNGQVTKSAKNTGANYAANKIYATPPLTINSLSLVTIPDPNLRAALQALGLISVFDNLLGTVSITSAGLTAQSIDISGKGIADLTGIDKFPALLTLKAGNNNLVSVDLSKLTLLTNLDLSKNQLTGLNLAANTALLSLDVSSNNLASLNVSANTLLTSLNVSTNKLTSLNLAANLALLSLDVSSNLLTSLDVHNNTLLTTLKVYGNPLVTLNISGLKALLSLQLASGVESINTVTKTLTVPVASTVQNLITDGVALTNWLNLVCTNNPNILSISVKNNTGLLSVTATGNTKLASLDVSGNATLTNLKANGNVLTTLNLASSLALLSLDVSVNKLTSLDLHNNILLTTLKVFENPLVTLNISGLKALSSLRLAEDVESINTATKTLTIPTESKVQNLITDGVLLANWLNLVCTNNSNILSISAKNNTGLLTVTATGNTKLASLDVSGNTTLTNVTANGNVLTSLNLTGDVGLLTLNAASNKLATINLAGQTAMTSVDVSTNLLTSLDLHNNILLTSVKCFGNALDTLNISGLVALVNLYLDNGATSAIRLLKFTVPVGATVKNLIANAASAAANWTTFDCTANPNIQTISLQTNTLLTGVVARNNNKLTSLNVTGSVLLTALTIQTSNNASGFTVIGLL